LTPRAGERMMGTIDALDHLTTEASARRADS
jgi:hypothetical protein